MYMLILISRTTFSYIQNPSLRACTTGQNCSLQLFRLQPQAVAARKKLLSTVE
jgi:hypothetical protein